MIGSILGGHTRDRQPLLICAPSNAGIDEIVRRIQDGIPQSGGKLFVPKVIRVGNYEAIAEDVRKVTMEAAIDKQFSEGRGDDVSEPLKASMKNTKIKLLNEADIVCTTLNGAGQDIFKELKKPFETVIIDEAGQATEPSALIPLKYGVKRCILVGGNLPVIGMS